MQLFIYDRGIAFFHKKLLGFGLEHRAHSNTQHRSFETPLHAGAGTDVPCFALANKMREIYIQPKKIYRLKEDQAFSLSLKLGQREKFARHPSADILLHSVGEGGDFVDTVIAF